MLTSFWARLTGAVHPDDAHVFDDFGDDHGFNLDYPPPAYWGDVVNAPILVLDNNGGYSEETPREFTAPDAAERHRERLRHPTALERDDAPPYYQRLNFFDWLEDGTAALVNAVAYRSIDSKARNVQVLADRLTSARIHRRWLHEVAFPAAQRNERMLIVHRWGLWRLKKGQVTGPSIVWSSAPVSPNLTSAERSTAAAWLLSR